MDVQSGGIPTVCPAESPAPSQVAETRAWPRSAQLAVAVLLALCLFLLFGRSLVQLLRAGPSTLPPQRVELNSATHAELMLLPGVGETLARRIIHVRAERGGFQSVDELRAVAGIGPVTLERARPWLFVSANPPAPVAQAKLPLAVEPSKLPSAKVNKVTLLDAPIDINSAGTGELMRIPGIGPVLSERIVAERGKRAFQTVEDLRRVRGIGPKVLEKIRPFVVAATSRGSELARNSEKNAP
jgi:competence protein ComEA